VTEARQKEGPDLLNNLRHDASGRQGISPRS